MLYRGNAYWGTYSPDGRRGVEMSHLVLYHIQTTAGAAPANLDADGIINSFTCTSCTAAGLNLLVNYTSESIGALVTAGATYLNLDVARCVKMVCCAAIQSAPVTIKGTDLYGNFQVEVLTISGANTTQVGSKAFKTITSITMSNIPAALGGNNTFSIGTTNKFGLPFHIAHTGKVAGIYVDGMPATDTTGTVVAGGSYAATVSTPTASEGALDVRGTVTPTTAPDGTKRFAVLMEVDASTRWKAFGQLPATAPTVTET